MTALLAKMKCTCVFIFLIQGAMPHVVDSYTAAPVVLPYVVDVPRTCYME